MFPVPLYTQNRFYGGASTPPPFVGPLDAYTTDLAACWSLSRRLLSSYAGPLFRARRVSDNAEMDVGTDSNGDLDEATLLAFCGGGDGRVARLYDHAGSARDYVMLVDTNQPQIVSAGAIVSFGVANRAAMECLGAATGMLATMGSVVTPTALSYAFAGVALNGCYNGQVGNPTPSFAAGGAILLYSPSATTVQTYVAGSVRGNGLTIVSGEDILAGMECGPTQVTHYRDGVANTPAAYSPTFGFQDIGLWFTGATVAGDGAAGAQFAEGALWTGPRGASVAGFQANQLVHFGL